MTHSEQIGVLKGLRHFLDTDAVYDPGREPINATSSYVDADLASREREAFFQGHPELIGLSPELPNVGSRQMFEDMNRALSMHEVNPVVDATFALDDAREAYRAMRAADHFGN